MHNISPSASPLTFPSIDEIIDLAYRAGEKAMKHFRSINRIDVHNKLNDSDIVTIADKECERVITDYIRQHFPTHAILSEESQPIAGSCEVRWVIDPIDGTTNFFAGIPLWAISIGVEREGQTEIGVVFMPATGEIFHAERGKGAFLNGHAIHVSNQTRLSRSVISTGFPVDKDVNPDNNLDNLAMILPKVRDIRRLGAATVDICYTAAGFLEGYWELNLHEWDVNAASLIVKEAGGIITRFRDDRGISVVCGPAPIHDQLLKILTDISNVRTS